MAYIFHMKLKHVVSFAHKLGQPLNGVQKAPALIVNRLYKQHKLDFQHRQVKCSDNKKYFRNNINALYEENCKIDKKDFRLNIGGDHSMSLATVAYTLNHYPNCKVIWVDAHPDINTYEHSETKNMHGMPLAYVTGLDMDRSFSFLQKTLSLDRLMYVGIRSLDDFEKQVIKKYKIPHFSCQDINEYPNECFQTIDNFLQDSPFHLSFDVDSFDPKVIKHTGTIVNSGLHEETGIALLQHLTRKTTLVNMDLTEINPDIDQSPIENTLQVIDKCLEPLWNHRQ